MNREDIIRMAHEAQFEGFGNGHWVCTTEEIEHFAALVYDRAWTTATLAGTSEQQVSDAVQRAIGLRTIIVQECVRLISDAVDRREPASTYVDMIKEHFGIEK